MAEKIGQILIRKGKINPSQLREALRTQQFFGGYLGSHLINLGFIDESALGETLSEIYRVPFAPFDSIRLARPEVLAKVPATLAQRYRLIPIQIDGNRLHLAMLNPRDAVGIGEVSAATGLNVTPWVAPEFRIIQALEKHYRLRKTGRGPIKLKGKGSPEALGAVEEPASQPVPVRMEYRPLATNAIGLDGHPIDATVIPDLGDSRIANPASGPVPRSLEEWREADEFESETDAAPAEAPVWDASVAAADAAEPESELAAPDARGTYSQEGSQEEIEEPAPQAEASPADLRAGPAARSADSARQAAPRSGRTAGGAGRRGSATASAAGQTARETARRSQGRGAAGSQGARAFSEPRAAAREARAGSEGLRSTGGFDQLAETLGSAASRDDVAREVVTFLAGTFRRAAAFAIRQGNAMGWIGSGNGFDPARIRTISVPVETSIFSAISASQSPYVGPAPASPESHDVFATLGGVVPPGILLVPILIRDRLVMTLYADNELDSIGSVDLALLKRLGTMTEVALEVIILRNKLKQI